VPHSPPKGPLHGQSGAPHRLRRPLPRNAHAATPAACSSYGSTGSPYGSDSGTSDTPTFSPAPYDQDTLRSESMKPCPICVHQPADTTSSRSPPTRSWIDTGAFGDNCAPCGTLMAIGAG